MRESVRTLLLQAFLPWLAIGWASAQEPEWLAYDFADATGQTFAQLQFGVAATEELAFTATCGAGSADIAVALHVETGAIPAGDPAILRIATPGHPAQARPGAVVEDAFGTHGVARLQPDDAVWPMLAAGLTATLQVEAGAPIQIHLRGSRVAIQRFLASCATLSVTPTPPVPPVAAAPPLAPDAEVNAADGAAVGADDAAATEAAEGAVPRTEDGTQAAAIPVPTAPPDAPLQPPYPLYITGEEPVPAFSAMRFGIVLDPLPPATTVRRTGRTGIVDRREWVEVTTVGARVRTVWVRRDELEPSSAGASSYQNPSPAGTLLMRAAPAADADVVGEIPARAVGILDQGQREGDWVLVSFSGTTGWVSHLYLLPIGPTLPPDQPPLPPVAAVPTAAPYTARHEGWTVDCDPCRDPALGPTCTVTSTSRATARRLATLVLNPDADGSMALAARYTANADFPGPPEAILTVTVDTTPPQTIPPDGWRLRSEAPDAVIAAAALGPLLPAVRGGQVLTLAVSDGARIWTDQFALAGFPQALDDLTARLPMPTRFGTAACPVPDQEQEETVADR